MEEINSYRIQWQIFSVNSLKADMFGAFFIVINSIPNLNTSKSDINFFHSQFVPLEDNKKQT